MDGDYDLVSACFDWMNANRQAGVLSAHVFLTARTTWSPEKERSLRHSQMNRGGTFYVLSERLAVRKILPKKGSVMSVAS